MTKPFLPSEIDLSGNDWFPLHFRRLQRSRWWRGASDLARSRNIDLWGRAFEEVPAGSLPDDDVELAEAAGFGRDVASFAAVKGEIMAPWTLCDDGRWYHPTLCEVALDTWNRLSAKRRDDRTRKARERERIKAANATRPAETSPKEGPSPSVSRVTGADVTRDMPTQTDRTGQTGQIISEPTVQAQSAPTDHVREAWARAVTLLIQSGRMKEPQARTFFGKLLKGGGLDAAQLLPSIVKAETLGTQDPQAYLSRAAEAILARSGGKPAPVDPATWGDDQWRVAVRLWRAEGVWSDGAGPRPGEPGCLVPASLLLEAA